MNDSNSKTFEVKSPRKVADHAFLRIHFEIRKTIDLIDDVSEALVQALVSQRQLKGTATHSSKYYCQRCVRRRNAGRDLAARLKNLQILAVEDPFPRAA